MFVNLLIRYKSLSIQVKAALWFTFCSCLQKGISFITVPIFTRLLSVEEYGAYSLYQSWLNLIMIIATLNLYSGAYFNGLYKYEDDRESFTSSMHGLSVTVTFITFIIYILFQNQFNNVTGLSTFISVMLFVELLMTPSVYFWMTKQRVEYKYVKLVIVTVAMSFMNPVLGIIAVMCTNIFKLEARIFSTGLVYLIFGGSLYAIQFLKKKRLYNGDYWRFALVFSLPLIPHNLSLSILSQSDRILIANIVGSKQAAIYSVAYSVAMVMAVIKDSINQALTPWFYENIKKNNIRSIKYNMNYIFAFMGIITFMFIAFAPEIIAIAAPIQYYEAIYVIPPVSAATYFTFLYTVFSAFEFYYEKTNYIMIASIIVAVLNVILNYIMIPKVGYIVAGYTTLFCYILLSVAHLLMMLHICNIKMGRKDILDYKFIVISSIVVILLTVLFSISYSNKLIRYTLVIILLIMLFVFRKKLKEIFISMRKE